MSFCTTAYGLSLQSEVTFPDLVPAPCAASPDVVIRQGKVTLPAEFAGKSIYFRLEKEVAYLFWRDKGAFQLREGRELLFEPAPGVKATALRPFLLGTVFATLLFQRDFLVLHASAAALQLTDGRTAAVAFAGHSGEGKSTMGAAMHQHGHLALTDDLVAIPEGEDAAPLVAPGFARFKLRAPSVEAMRASLPGALPWSDEHEAYLLRLSERFATAPQPLQAIYFLGNAPSVRIEPLSGPDALMKLVNISYCVRAMNAGNSAHNFLWCAQLMRRVPMFQLLRPRDLERLDEVVQAVEEHSCQLSRL